MPENAGYYHAAYAAAAIIYLVYALSLWRRRRALNVRAGGHENERAPRGGGR